MNNLYGPFTTDEWETLLMLRKTIRYEADNHIDGDALSRDTKDFAALAYRAA